MIRKNDDLHMDRGSFPRAARLGEWQKRLQTYVAVLGGRYRPIVRKRLTPDVLSKFSY